MGTSSALFLQSKGARYRKSGRPAFAGRLQTQKRSLGSEWSFIHGIDFTLVPITVLSARGVLQVASACPFRPVLYMSPPCSSPGRRTFVGGTGLQCPLASVWAWITGDPGRRLGGGEREESGTSSSGSLSGPIYSSTTGNHCCSPGGWFAIALPFMLSPMIPPFLPLGLGW